MGLVGTRIPAPGIVVRWAIVVVIGTATVGVVRMIVGVGVRRAMELVSRGGL